MNKLKLKKFLTLLVCLMLIASMTLLVACNKNADEDNNEESFTATPTFTNGNFTSFTSSDKYPKTPSSWTHTPTSDPDGYNFVISDIVGGIISLNSSDYEAYKSNWGNLAIFGKNTTELTKDYTEDDDVLMLYNKVKGYQVYTSSSSTASANSYYKLSVDIRTHGIDGTGATIIFYDYSNNVNLATFNAVTSNDEWTRYTFYFKTKATSSSIALKLSLGNIESTSVTEDSLTAGYAFFDNVQLSTINADKDNDKTASEVYAELVNAKAAHTQALELALPNGNFDYVKSFSASNPYPALFDRISDANNYHSYNRIDLSENNYVDSMASIGVTATADNAPSSVGVSKNYSVSDKNYAYALNAKTGCSTALGFSTAGTLYFKRGTAYAVSVYVNTANLTAGKAAVTLTANDEKISADDLSYSVQKGKNWQKLTFIVIADQNTATDLYFQMWLELDDTTAPLGYAFFDCLSIEEITVADSDGYRISDWEAKFTGENSLCNQHLDKTITEDASLITNGYFSGTKGTNGWKEVNDEGKTDMLDKVDNSMVSMGVVDVLSPEFKSLSDSAYTSVTTNVLKVSTTSPTIYGLSYNRDWSDTKINLKAFTAYRFSIWVKTEDVQSTAGITLNVYDNGTRDSIAAFTNVNANSVPEAEGLNGYRELACYIYTGKTAEKISFEVRFGSGSQLTPTTLFDGTAYLCNASLTEIEYKKFSAASSGTYVKIKNYNTTVSGNFVNDQFEVLDMTKTTGFTGNENDGKISDEFQKTTFGVPSSWTFTKDKTLDGMPQLYTGIVDIDRTNLLNNLKASAGIDESYTVGSGDDAVTKTAKLEALAGYDFTQLMYLPDANADNYLNLATYATSHSALMLAAPNITYSGANFASMYYSSKSFSLTADTYYEISVLVKTLNDTRASVYLTSDNEYEMNRDAKFENIKATEVSDATTNGWRKYTFFVKVGFSSVDVQLKLYLGANNSPTTSADGLGLTQEGGVAFFDFATVISSTAEKYDSVQNNENNVAIALDTDSFGSTKSSSSSTVYLTPATSTWTGTADVTAGSTNDAGIVVKGTYDFSQTVDENLENKIVGHSGDSCLVIRNSEASAYHFTSYAGKTFSKGLYYKVSVYVKTINVPEGSNAYVRLDVTNYKKPNSGENKILVNSSDYQLVEFFVKAPAKNTLTTAVKLTLGLGEEGALVSGYAIFDDVKFEQIETITDDADNAKFNALAVGDYASAVIYNDITNTEVDPDKEPENPENAKNDYRWIIFTSVAFGAVLIIIVLIYFFKKYLPKRKAKADLTKKPKKGDKDVDKGEYDNLKD